MGVSGTFQFLKEKYIPEDVREEHLEGTLHVDFNAILAGYCNKTLHSIKAANWKKPLPRQKSQHTIVEQFVLALVKKFPSFITPENSVLHFDGYPTQEKNRAHAERLKKFTEEYGNHISSANAELDQAVNALGLFNTSGPRAARQRRSVLGHASRAIASYKRIRTFSLDRSTTADIGAALRTLGWRVCFCSGETDNCILNLDAPTVVTTDSDYLFRGARILLRKDPKIHDKYTAYVVHDILSTLEVHPDAWKVVGVVSGNDYSGNIRGQGVTRNLAFIKARCSRGPLTASTILQRYCKLMSEGDRTEEIELIGRFKMAEAVFIRNQETLLNDQASGSKRDIIELERKLFQVLGQVSVALFDHEWLRSYKAAKKDISDATSRTTAAAEQRQLRKYAVKFARWDPVGQAPQPLPIPAPKLLG